jgi:RimJ/RimL family protein N-acetyltransferase
MVTLIPFDSLPDEHLEGLAQILNSDAALNQQLGTDVTQPVSLEELKQTAAHWQQTHNGVIYCIWTNCPVGTISLGQREDGDTARIGYWIASSQWGQGIAREAFRQVLEIAHCSGMRGVKASIDSQNIASLRLWRRYGAAESPQPGGQVVVYLELPLRSQVTLSNPSG